MGNFIENTFSGIGNAVNGLFGGSSSSRPSIAQQVQEAAKRKAIEDSSDTPLDENTGGFGLVAQLARAHPEILRGSRNAPGSSGGVPMKKGGSVSARADGCAQRGKTKGRFV